MSDVEAKVRDTLCTIARDQNINNYDIILKPISTGGANYTSKLYLGTISGDKEINVFAKIAALGEKLRAQSPLKMYDTERYFYTYLMKIYSDLEEKNGLSEDERLKLPIFYGCNPKLYEETIVLQDLAHHGYTTHDRMKIFDWAYASASVTVLAKFHALSIAYQKNNKEAFDADIVELKADFEKSENNKEIWEKFIKTSIEAVNEEHRDKMNRYIETKFKKEQYRELCEAKKVQIIMHGDYRPSNLMHKKLENGKVEVIPVDFQTLRGGSPIVDLLYFIFTGSDEEFRRKYYDQLVEHYYSELRAAMIRLGVEPGYYTKEDFDEELKEKLPFGLLTAIILLPIVTVEAKNAPQVDENMDTSSFVIQKKGQLFSERFNGIINDYVRWGVLT